MTSIEKFRYRRELRLRKRAFKARFDADEENGSSGGHGNTKLPYGIAKSKGIDTNGMSPKEVWQALEGEGVSAKEEYKKLSEKSGSKGHIFKSPDGQELSNCEISSTGLGSKYKYQISGKTKDGNTKKSITAGSKDALLLALRDAGVTSVTVDGKKVNPQKADLPKVLFKESGSGADYISKIDFDKNTGIVSLKSIDGSSLKNFGMHKDLEDVRDEILEMSDGKFDIAKSDDVPKHWAKYLSGLDKLEGTYTSSDGRRTFRKLKISKTPNNQIELSGSVDGLTGYSVGRFPSEKELLVFLKEHNIPAVGDNDNQEIVDYSNVEKPKYIGFDPMGHGHLEKVTVAKNGSRFEIRGTNISGETKSLIKKDNYKQCVEYARENLGVDESDLTVSSRTRKFI